MTEHKWRDIHGDSGRLSSDPDDLIISIELHEGKEGYAAHDIPIAEARAIHEALGRALAEVDHRPVTDSISATLAACSAPVPDILRKIDAACGESHLINVVHSPDGTRVYRTPGTLRDVSVEELAKMGLKPSQPEPPPTGNGASALHPRPFFWDSNERFGFVNVPDGYVTEPERMTLAQLLECVPNALNAHESHHPLESGQYPRFGFCREHTGPRTLREYLEAP